MNPSQGNLWGVLFWSADFGELSRAATRRRYFLGGRTTEDTESAEAGALLIRSRSRSHSRSSPPRRQERQGRKGGQRISGIPRAPACNAEYRYGTRNRDGGTQREALDDFQGPSR